MKTRPGHNGKDLHRKGWGFGVRWIGYSAALGTLRGLGQHSEDRRQKNSET